MKSEKGITLVEALTTLAIATVVGTLLLVIMINTGGLFTKQSSKLNLGLSVNDAISQMQKSIRQSQSVVDTSTQEQLILRVPSTSSSGDVITNIFDLFYFQKDGSKLIFKVVPDTASYRAEVDQIFSNNVDLLNFEYFDSQNPPQVTAPNLATKIRITLKLKQKAGAEYEQNIATSEANLRND